MGPADPAPKGMADWTDRFGHVTAHVGVLIDRSTKQRKCSRTRCGRTRGPREVMLRSSSFVWYAVTSGSPAGVLIVMSTAADPTCVRSGVYTCHARDLVIGTFEPAFLQCPCQQM